MTYSGDVNDTPPLWIRLLAAVACLFGGAFMLYGFVSASLVVPTIVVGAGLLLAVYLVATVPRAGQTALVAALYWGLLGCLALFMPFQIQ
jgi:hypothetical protein